VLAGAMLGCTGSFPPPPATPLPEAWKPASVLRAQVPRAHAGEVVLDDRDGLSPDEAAILALDQNPRLQAARAERGRGQAELIEAGVLPNPRLDAALDVPVGGAEAKVLGYGAGLSWNVTPLLSRGARVSAAEEGLESVDLDIAWQEWQVAQAARLHAIRAIYLERRTAVARELEASGRQRLEGLQRARAAEAVTELEVSNAERSWAEARVSRLELEQQVVAARAELQRALGVDGDHDLVLDLSFAPLTRMPLRETVLAGLPQRRLDLIALQHAQRSHDAGLRAAVLARFPPVEIGFQARREVDRNSSVGATLSIELPFFEQTAGAFARERALHTQVEAEYAARLLEARTEVVRALQELGLLDEQLSAARAASEAGVKLAEQARTAMLRGALNPLLETDILEHAFAARLRAIEIEQGLAELQVVLALASGVDRW
jgi:outer membrane protein TolC